MSDEEIGKKMVEERDLELFLEAYEHATGERIQVASRGESPDFRCLRADGQAVGVELTQIMQNPLDTIDEKNIGKSFGDDPFELSEQVQFRLEEKEAKRLRYDPELAANTILVIQFVLCPLSRLLPLLTEDTQQDYSGHGFIEVWIADYTGVEAYGDIELFCVFPGDLWGHYQRRNPDRKPYG